MNIWNAIDIEAVGVPVTVVDLGVTNMRRGPRSDFSEIYAGRQG